MEEITIRKAVLSDMPVLLIFEQGVIATERPFDLTLKHHPINYYDIEKMITSEEVELLVATINNTLIGSGYARIENAKPYVRHLQHAYLGFMYVVPEHRGKGVNKKIMDELTKWCVEKNITEQRLDVYYNNESAFKAYEKTGFKKHMIEMRRGI